MLGAASELGCAISPQTPFPTRVHRPSYTAESFHLPEWSKYTSDEPNARRLYL